MTPADLRPDADRAQLRLAAIAALRLREREERERYAADPWSWYGERVNLLDPLEPPGRQIAPYPDFAYTRAVVREMTETLEPLIIWKARRMVISYSVCAEFARRAAHMENQRLYYITRTEGENAGEGARELIARTVWILENLRPGPKINYEASRLQITFPDTGSTITGMGAGEPNKMRSMAANVAFCDEFGFWENAEEAYTALRRTVEGRGKIIIACSTALGFFKQLVYDESDSWMAPASFSKKRPDTAQNVTTYCDGMEAWNNAGNGFRVIGLDYWADPRKQRGSEWEARERKGTTERAWRQEMLREFNPSAGRPVFEYEWDAARMVVTPEPPEEGRPLIVSLDFGYNRPAATVSQFRYGRIWRVLRAYMGNKVHFTPFMRTLMVLLQEWFPELETLPMHWCCDFAGTQEGHDAHSEVDTLKKLFGIVAKNKYSLVPPTVDRMRDYMVDTCTVNGRSGVPCFQVERHPSTRIIVDALNGGYKYPESKSGKPEPEKPDDDGYYIHPMDTLRYTGLNFGGRRVTPGVDLAKLAARDILGPTNFVLR